VFSAGAVIYNPQMTEGHEPVNAYTRVSNGDCYGPTIKQSGGGSTKRYPRSVQRFNVINNDDPEKTHPTQKPVALMEYLVRTYTNPGDSVMDFCMGSGTTALAALITGRRFIGIEKEEKYFNIACERVRKACDERATNVDASAA
jgi:site-specific DNA-methyltransferase (adenine-specific)